MRESEGSRLITTRRQLLGAGACAGLLATTSKASTLAEIVASLQDKPVPAPVSAAPAPHYAMPAPVPAQPRVIVDAAIDPRLLGRARAAFDRHRHSLRHTDTVGIVDYSRLSREPRFYLFNTGSGQVSTHLVAHGRGVKLKGISLNSGLPMIRTGCCVPRPTLTTVPSKRQREG